MKRWLNSTLDPILWYSTSLFFLPCDYNGRIVKWRLVISVLFSCLILTLLLHRFITDISRDTVVTNLQKLARARKTLRVVTCIVNIFCQNYWFIFHPKAFESIIKRLRILTQIFGDSVAFTRINWFIGLTVLSVLYSIQIGTLYYGFERFAHNLFVYFIPQSYSMVITVQVTALLEILRCLFQKLNEETKVSKRLPGMADIHSALCKVASDVTKLYSIQLFFLISESLLYMTTQWYQLFKVITGNETLEGTNGTFDDKR